MKSASRKPKGFSYWQIIHAGFILIVLGAMLHPSRILDFLAAAFTAPSQTLSFSVFPTLLFWSGVALTGIGTVIFFFSYRAGNTYPFAQQDHANEEESWIFL